MSIAQAAKCDACGITATVPRSRTNPEGWFLVFEPEGRFDLCSPACMSDKYRPHTVTGLVQSIARGGS